MKQMVRRSTVAALIGFAVLGGMAFGQIVAQKTSNGQLVIGPALQCSQLQNVYSQISNRITQQQNQWAEQDLQTNKQRTQQLNIMDSQEAAYQNAAQTYCNETLQ